MQNHIIIIITVFTLGEACLLVQSQPLKQLTVWVVTHMTGKGWAEPGLPQILPPVIPAAPEGFL